MGYTSHRWQAAGGTESVPFDQEALKLIYDATGGLPRAVVYLCNNALIYAYGQRSKVAKQEAVKYAIAERPKHKKGKEDDVK
jgi:type II secretory pathway predicted ATPase ExeA